MIGCDHRSVTAAAGAAGASQEAAGQGAGLRAGLRPRPAARRRRRRLRRGRLPLGGGVHLQGLQERSFARRVPGCHRSCPYQVGTALMLSVRETRARFLAQKIGSWSTISTDCAEQPGPGVAQRRSAAPRLMPSASAASWCDQAGEVAQLDQLRGRGIGLASSRVSASSSASKVVGAGLGGGEIVGQVDAHAGRRRACRPACGGPVRRGCGAWPRPRRRRSGRGCSSAGLDRRRPAAGRPRGPGPWPAASAPALPGPVSTAASRRSSS